MAAFLAPVIVLLHLYFLIWRWFAGIFLNLKVEHNGKGS